MSPTDHIYLQACKAQIQRRYAMGNAEGRLRQRDFLYLIDQIEAAAGIRLSLSTLKRLWQPDVSHLPQAATLDALVSLLEYPDWGQFKQAHADLMEHQPSVSASKSVKPGAYAVFTFPPKPLYVLLALIGLGAGLWFFGAGDSVTVNGPVRFQVDQTVKMGVPNTFIFTYDLSSVEADSFFIQQSWDPRNKVEIDPDGQHFSSVYLRPGYHTARLIANDSILATCPVHVQTEDWFAFLSCGPDTRFMDTSLQKVWHISAADLRQVDFEPDSCFLNVRYTGALPLISTRHFSFQAKVRAQAWSNLLCPEIAIMIHGQTNVIRVPIGPQGCVGQLDLLLGGDFQAGREHDFSGLGVADIGEWQELKLAVEDERLMLFIGDSMRFETSFPADIGLVKGIGFRSNVPMDIERAELTQQ